MAPRLGDSEILKCSFCSKSQRQVVRLIAGPNNVYICDECIDLCNEIMEEESAEAAAVAWEDLPKPKEIVEFLDQWVIGQDDAKRSLAVAVYTHYKRVQLVELGSVRAGGEHVELQKSNLLLVGPTGSG